MREHAVQRTRHARQIERLDERRREGDLPVREKASQLFLHGAAAMRRLLLVGAERSQQPVGGEDALHRLDAEATDQLVLQVTLADEEAEPLHPCAVEVGADTGPLERAAKRAL